jgi:hypothetical protein
MLAFLVAAHTGDMDALNRVLTEDVVAVPIGGADQLIHCLFGLMREAREGIG